MVPFNCISNIDDVRGYNRGMGYHFFDPEAMRFFDSRIGEDIKIIPGVGVGFVTSEKFDYKTPRLYTARVLEESGNVKSLSEFQAFTSSRHAYKFLENYQAEKVSSS
jgi:hypothetical protein